MTLLLTTITNSKKKELQQKKKKSAFFLSLSQSVRRVACIAEIKCSSPTAGVLLDHRHIVCHIKKYQQAHVDALSIVVDTPFFGGSYALIQTAKQYTDIPILVKDFVIDPYQIYEAKMYGGDAILLLARLLSQKNLSSFVALAKTLGLEPVVEIDTLQQLPMALSSGARCIGVNARDLSTFHVDRVRACSILATIPQSFLSLGFSGVETHEHIDAYARAGARGVLVGTTLLKSQHPDKRIRSLFHSYGN